MLDEKPSSETEPKEVGLYGVLGNDWGLKRCMCRVFSGKHLKLAQPVCCKASSSVVVPSSLRSAWRAHAGSERSR